MKLAVSLSCTAVAVLFGAAAPQASVAVLADTCPAASGVKHACSDAAGEDPIDVPDTDWILASALAGVGREAGARAGRN